MGKDYIETFPEADSPEISGLHPNAELTFRINEVNAMIATLGETQPKGGGGGGEYNEDDYKFKINKLGGLTVPLNIFLFQEIQRLQNVILKTRTMSTELQQAIRGEIVMTQELADSLQSIFEAKPPTYWVFTVAGDEFSWILV